MFEDCAYRNVAIFYTLDCFESAVESVLEQLQLPTMVYNKSKQHIMTQLSCFIIGLNVKFRKKNYICMKSSTLEHCVQNKTFIYLFKAFDCIDMFLLEK